MLKKSKSSFGCFFAIMLVTHLSAYAETFLAPQPLEVLGTITAGCEIQNTNGGKLGDFNFGSYSSLSTETITTELEEAFGFKVTCTRDVDLWMSIDGGGNYTSSRRLANKNKTDFIPYRLFSKNERFAENEVPPNTSFYAGRSVGEPFRFPLFASVKLNGVSPPGIFTDKLTVTFIW